MIIVEYDEWYQFNLMRNMFYAMTSKYNLVVMHLKLYS